MERGLKQNTQIGITLIISSESGFYKHIFLQFRSKVLFFNQTTETVHASLTGRKAVRGLYGVISQRGRGGVLAELSSCGAQPPGLRSGPSVPARGSLPPS